MSRLTGFEVMATSDGNVLQSGAQSKPSVKHMDVGNTGGWITRAVVLQTYYADEDDRKLPWASGVDKQRHVLCDVRTYGRYSRVLPKVPVLQRLHGLHDQDVYIPRPARVNTTGGDLVTSPPESGSSRSVTPAEDMDGDHVVIGFLDNDPNQPVILPFSMSHPKSSYTPTKDAGRVRVLSHNGISVTWDKDSNFTIDATGAASDELSKSGEPQSVSGTGGKVIIKTKNGGGDESSITLDETGKILGVAPADIKWTSTDDVHLDAGSDVALIAASTVHLGKDGATESVMLGDKYNAAEQKLWGDPLVESSEQEQLPISQGGQDRGKFTIGNGLQEFFAAMEELMKTASPSGWMVPPTASSRMNNALSELFDLIKEFQDGKSDWLSTKVKTE